MRHLIRLELMFLPPEGWRPCVAGINPLTHINEISPLNMAIFEPDMAASRQCALEMRA
jgi:hypothetical protein